MEKNGLLKTKFMFTGDYQFSITNKKKEFYNVIIQKLIKPCKSKFRLGPLAFSDSEFDF
jgi:hypothetical protein